MQVLDFKRLESKLVETSANMFTAQIEIPKEMY
jgi:hypothetical protein